MKKAFLTCAALAIVISFAAAQTPNWEDAVLTGVTDTERGKTLSDGSLFVDDNDFIHTVYLQQRDAQEPAENVLYYTMRDSQNEWSSPESIAYAGHNFNRPNVIFNRQTRNVEIYGDIDGTLHQIIKADDEEWSGEAMHFDDYDIYEVNVAIDDSANRHIAGITYTRNNERKIIYITDYNGDWEYHLIEESIPSSQFDLIKPVISTTEEGLAVIGYIGEANGTSRVNIAQNREPGQDAWFNEAVETPNEVDQSFDLIVKDNDINLVSTGQLYWPGRLPLYHLQRNIEEQEWSEPELTNPDYSSAEPTMVVDDEGYVHIVCQVFDFNQLPTGEIRYSTNVGEEWEVSNPFEENYNWKTPLLALDCRNEFQMIVVKSSANDIHEIAHIGVPLDIELPVPHNLSAEVDNTDIILRWEEPVVEHPQVPSVLGFNVYRKHSEDIDFQIINPDIVTDTTYVDKDLEPGIYDYYVTAVYEDYQESEPSNVTRETIKEQLPPPVFDPEPGKYSHVLYVSIKCPDELAENIHFTTDGSQPDEDSPVFEVTIIVAETTTIKAKSFHPDYSPSEIAVAEYIIEEVSVDESEYQFETELVGAYPNPFNPYTNISYNVGENTHVNLAVFNIKGQLVKSLVNSKQSPGEYSVRWNGMDKQNNRQPSGVYYFRLTTDDVVEVFKAVLMK